MGAYVNFASAVASTGAVSLKVTKADANVEVASTKWAANNKSVVLTTVAKMTKGTYTVTAKEGEKETSGSEEVVAQYVKEIKVLNSVALTGVKRNGAADGTDLESGECYVYYDVLDQYGESLKNSTTVEWSTSAVKDSDRKADGKLTLSRSDKKAFTYGEQIYITGVYAKTGVSTTATLTVGAKRLLHTNLVCV